MFRQWTLSIVLACGLGINGSALAMSSSDTVQLGDVEQLIAAGRYSEAVNQLQTYVQDTPFDANGFNLLGYSYRKLEEYERAHNAYDRALKLDPGHKGAHEYLGELYLKTGERHKAEAQLAVLEKLCGTDCAEYRKLAKAITAQQ